MKRFLFCLLLVLAPGAKAETASFEFLSSAQALETVLGSAAVRHDAGSALAYAGSLVPQSHVPEPETYLQILAGLGLFGFIMRRRMQLAELA